MLGFGSFSFFSLVFFPSPKLIIPFSGVDTKVVVLGAAGDSFSCLSSVIKMETSKSRSGVRSLQPARVKNGSAAPSCPEQCHCHA